MQRNEPLQAVYKGLSSHFIKSSYVVIWYMILFRQKNTDRPSARFSFFYLLNLFLPFATLHFMTACVALGQLLSPGQPLAQHLSGDQSLLDPVRVWDSR